MFGMSSKEFWEEEPQLYWAYRFSYEKRLDFESKADIEKTRFACWLQGKTNEIAYSVALGNAFGKQAHYPTFEELFRSTETNINPVKAELTKKLEGITDKDERARLEFEYWARL